MTQDLSAVQDSFVQLWGALGTFWGVSPTTARVYGWLLARADGGDAEEIMEGLGLSRGAVSMACKELRDWSLITPERAPGARRVRYLAEADLAKVMRNVVQVRKHREWDPILENLREWIPRLEADESPDAAVFLERLEAIEGIVTLANSMAEVFLKGGTVGAFGLKALVGSAKPGARDRRRKTANANLAS